MCNIYICRQNDFQSKAFRSKQCKLLRNRLCLSTLSLIFVYWSLIWSKSIFCFLLRVNRVGKSSFMTRFVDHRFTNLYRATIGVDFLTKELTIDKTSVILQVRFMYFHLCQICDFKTLPCNILLFLPQIWDTAGTERFHSLGTSLYRGAHCCLLVFDVTSLASFTALEGWKKEFLVQAGPSDPTGFPFIVIGNKVDLENREVSRKLKCKLISKTQFIH